MDWYESGDPSTPHRLPGKTSYDAVTLSAGVTHDLTFEKWANLVNNFQGDSAMSLKNFRKNIIIDVFNEAGSWQFLTTCFAAGFPSIRPFQNSDAAGNAVMIQTLKLENEGWQRDDGVKEPSET